MVDFYVYYINTSVILVFNIVLLNQKQARLTGTAQQRHTSLFTQKSSQFTVMCFQKYSKHNAIHLLQ